MAPRKRTKTDPRLPPRVYPHGRGWRMRIYIEGKPGWHRFQARDLDELWLEYARFVGGATPHQHTIGKGIERYMERVVPELLRSGRMSPSTWRTERRRCEKLIEVWGHMRPDDVRRSHIYDAMEVRDGVRLLKRLSAIWKYFLRWEIATTNPFDGIEWPRDQARERYLTDEETRLARAVSLDRAFHGQPSAIMVWAAIWLIELTGRRVSDVRRLQFQHLTEEGIRFREGKTKKWTIVEWSDELRLAVEEIKRLCAPSKGIRPMFLICNARGYECSEGSLNQAFQRLRPWFELAGLEPFQMRDLRGKYATDLEAAGDDATRHLQHSSRRVTRKHYLRKGQKVRSLR